MICITDNSGRQNWYADTSDMVYPPRPEFGMMVEHVPDDQAPDLQDFIWSETERGFGLAILYDESGVADGSYGVSTEAWPLLDGLQRRWAK